MTFTFSSDLQSFFPFLPSFYFFLNPSFSPSLSFLLFHFCFFTLSFRPLFIFSFFFTLLFSFFHYFYRFFPNPIFFLSLFFSFVLYPFFSPFSCSPCFLIFILVFVFLLLPMTKQRFFNYKSFFSNRHFSVLNIILRMFDSVFWQSLVS